MSNYEAILPLVKANDPNFTELCITPETLPRSVLSCTEFGNDVGGNSNLKKLTFSWTRQDIENDLPEAFCAGLAKNQSIEILHFDSTYLLMTREALGILAPFFENNSNLKELSIDENLFRKLGNFDAMCSLLSSCKNLKSIKINGRRLDREQMRQIIVVLGGMPSLESISIRGPNYGVICTDVSDELAAIIESKQSALRELSLFLSVERSCWLVDLARLLRNNDKLTSLRFGQYSSVAKQTPNETAARSSCRRRITNERINRLGWDELERTFRFYNDTMEEFTVKGVVPDRIQQLLLMNRNKNKKFVRFRKCLDYDFLRPARGFNEEPFGEEFEMPLLPYVLWSIGSERHRFDRRDCNLRHSALFYFVRSMPMLVVGSIQKVTGTSAPEKSSLA